MYRFVVCLTILAAPCSASAQLPRQFKKPLDAKSFIALSKLKRHRELRAAGCDALHWIQRQQHRDGGWSFSTATGGFAKPGANPSRVEATAMSMLAVMGVGGVHLKGDHADVVSAGLAFLGSHMKLHNDGVDARGPDGDLVAHALATLVLCQLYEMTSDADLKATAAGCVDYLIKQQDPKTGGWRCKRGRRPSLEAHIWPVLALYSGGQAKLADVANAQKIAGAFVDAHRLDDGPLYVDGDRKNPALATAQALACRRYLGERIDAKAANGAARYLSEKGPADHDAAYDFLVTLSLFHEQGEIWKNWNEAMRNRAVDSQQQIGSQAGSWYDAKDREAKQAGQLYQTALRALSLEVYYRHLPFFQPASAAE